MFAFGFLECVCEGLDHTCAALTQLLNISSVFCLRNQKQNVSLTIRDFFELL